MNHTWQQADSYDQAFLGRKIDQKLRQSFLQAIFLSFSFDPLLRQSHGVREQSVPSSLSNPQLSTADCPELSVGIRPVPPHKQYSIKSIIPLDRLRVYIAI